jgi:hypothetical protein
MISYRLLLLLDGDEGWMAAGVLEVVATSYLEYTAPARNPDYSTSER